jgi:hypothetical protein
MPSTSSSRAAEEDSSPPLDRKAQRLPVRGRIEARAPLFDHEHLLLGDLLRDAVEPREKRGTVRALPDLPLQVEKERLQVQRLVEVVDEQLEVQQLLLERAGAATEKGVDDRSEHVLAQRALGLLSPADQLRIESSVHVAGLDALAQGRVALLAFPKVARGPEAEDRDGQRGQQAAQGLQNNRGLVPPIPPRGGARGILRRLWLAGSRGLRHHLPASCFATRS